MQRLRDAITGLVIGILLCGVIAIYRSLRPPMPSILALPAKELKGETLAEIPCRTIFVYRDKVRDKLGVPEGAGQVTDSRQIKADEHPHTVTSVIDDIGRTTIYDRRDPLPWLAFDTSKELSLSYGYRDGHTGAVGRLGGRLDMVSIKSLRLGVVADVDTGGGWFAGAGVRVRW